MIFTNLDDEKNESCETGTEEEFKFLQEFLDKIWQKDERVSMWIGRS